MALGACASAVFYLVWPEGVTDPRTAEPTIAWGLDILADGAATRTDLHVEVSQSLRVGWAGMSVPRRLVLRARREDQGLPSSPWMEARITRLVDDGPFYVRGLIQTDTKLSTVATREHAIGFVEVVRPDRVDLPQHRPLVRMAIQQPDPRADSCWLPLFSGPTGTRSRVWRLLSQMRTRRDRL